MSQYDLMVLVADADTEATIRELLHRHQALGIRRLTCEIRRHRYRDNGCFRKSHDFLRLYYRSHDKTLLVFDREGCGAEHHTREQLESLVQEQLRANSWQGDRAEVLVLDPELEIWAWSRSAHVAQTMKIGASAQDAANWLVEQGFCPLREIKPARPKEALDVALRKSGSPWSPRIHRDLASKISFAHCADPAFLKFRGFTAVVSAHLPPPGHLPPVSLTGKLQRW